jgi:hypothetical protein
VSSGTLWFTHVVRPLFQSIVPVLLQSFGHSYVEPCVRVHGRHRCHGTPSATAAPNVAYQPRSAPVSRYPAPASPATRGASW